MGEAQAEPHECQQPHTQWQRHPQDVIPRGGSHEAGPPNEVGQPTKTYCKADDWRSEDTKLEITALCPTPEPLEDDECDRAAKQYQQEARKVEQGMHYSPSSACRRRI